MSVYSENPEILEDITFDGIVEYLIDLANLEPSKESRKDLDAVVRNLYQHHPGSMELNVYSLLEDLSNKEGFFEQAEQAYWADQDVRFEAAYEAEKEREL